MQMFIVLNNGQTIRGAVLRKDAKEILVKLDYGTLTCPLANIREVKQEETAADIAKPEEATERGERRIPEWAEIVTQLAKKSWASGLKQIPATVIDKGILQYVPYVSFGCGSAYELNIYGDLDNPAGVEIGVRQHLLTNDRAKGNCLDLISSILLKKDDRERVRKLNRNKDVAEVEGLVFEITPPTDEDAYGGWWISVYNKEALEKARASEKELLEITELPVLVIPQTPSVATQLETTPRISSTTSTSWSAEDYRSARSSQASYSRGGGGSGYVRGSGGSGGTVYVRSYYRKDGTYVRSHTRRAPK